MAWGLVAAVDKYIVENEPWSLGEKQDEESRSRLGTVLYTSCGSAAGRDRACPSGDARRNGENLGAARAWETSRNSSCLNLQWGQLHLGTKLGEVQAVFPRADKSAVERMQKMEEQRSGGAPATTGRNADASGCTRDGASASSKTSRGHTRRQDQH